MTLHQSSPIATMDEAKKIVIEGIKKGVTCPCCGQHAQIYRRTITKAMATGLWILWSMPRNEKDENGFFHMESCLKKYAKNPAIRGDMPKLKLWGIIEPLNERRPDGSTRNGYYRITEKGKQFIEGTIEVEKHLFIFNDNIEGKSNETIRFNNCYESDGFTMESLNVFLNKC